MVKPLSPMTMAWSVPAQNAPRRQIAARSVCGGQIGVVDGDHVGTEGAGTADPPGNNRPISLQGRFCAGVLDRRARCAPVIQGRRKGDR
ncbi:hypothetical protein [Streptomyces lydicus]|uniref:hypothetical protein n=1 Tax=Streptomyces lydicus TaxID=47763 RepID=UPI0033173041